MKMFVLVAVFVALFTLGTPVFAQRAPEDSVSDYYYLKVHIEMIWPHRGGYVVQYRRGGFRGTGRAYLPLSWFSTAAAKGEIISLPRGNAWPTMAVYYREGEFSHVRLYVHSSPAHQTWGTLPQNADINHFFEGVETINLVW